MDPGPLRHGDVSHDARHNLERTARYGRQLELRSRHRIDMPTATIRLFLVHGDAKRLRTAELSNWTGKAVAGPRSELDTLLARDEAAKPGIYFLTGTDLRSGESAVYVGEAESVRDRLRGHLDREFWNHVVFFISKDENLTKAHVRYLEGHPSNRRRPLEEPSS